MAQMVRHAKEIQKKAEITPCIPAVQEMRDYRGKDKKMNVKSILAIKGQGVITIGPEQTIREAILRMENHNIGSLVVVDNIGEMVGIITERHIIRLASKVENLLSARVNEMMATEVITGVPLDDLPCLIDTMTKHRIRHLPILDQGRLVGMVSIGDVLKAQRDEYAGEVTTLETQILAD